MIPNKETTNAIPVRERNRIGVVEKTLSSHLPTKSAKITGKVIHPDIRIKRKNAGFQSFPFANVFVSNSFMWAAPSNACASYGRELL